MLPQFNSPKDFCTLWKNGTVGFLRGLLAPFRYIDGATVDSTMAACIGCHVPGLLGGWGHYLIRCRFQFHNPPFIN